METLYIYDCGSGKLRRGQIFPLSIGNTPECGCRVAMQPVVGGAFMLRNGSCSFYPRSSYCVNGAEVATSMVLEAGKPYMFSMDGGLFVVLYDEQGASDSAFAAVDNSKWYYFDYAANVWQGPLSIPQLAGMTSSLRADSWVMCSGLSKCMCHFGEFLAMAAARSSVTPEVSAAPAQTGSPSYTAAAVGVAASSEPAEPEDEPIDEENGKYLCPTCWLRFDAGDVMNIANHPDLMGDPVLGRDAMLRFFATRFNAKGQALDEKGMPCMHYACPHCRRKLPPHFMELPHHIFSIIGAPSAGKSYYLASLVHEMEFSMGPDFGLGWKDASPADNSMLNDVINRLFSADAPEDAYLSKTDLEGALYEEFYRHGRMVKLPKPFVYTLSKPGRYQPVSMVFYDNAGEHFEPGRNSEDSPGAGHVAVAHGLFFLFDPVTNKNFRRMLAGKDDPQLSTDARHMDQQNIIMAETYTRISDTLNLAPGEQLDVPFAVMIGKSDLWEDLLPEGGTLLPICEGGKVIRKRVDANSEILRRFLMKFNPSLCMTAESISSNVRYFAVSPLGCAPVSFTDPLGGVKRIGPDPQKIAPRHVCEPTLWVLSQLEPQIIPSV